MKQHSIHVSDILAFKRCRRQWDWSSRLRNNLETKRPYSAFLIGSAVHYCLENIYKGDEDVHNSLKRYVADHHPNFSGMPSLWQNGMIDDIDLARSIADHYLKWSKDYTGPFKDSDFEFLEQEKEFSVPLSLNGVTSQDHVLGGRFDGIVRSRKDGKLYIWEIKTTRSIQERLRSIPFEEQATFYTLAAKELYKEEIGGVVYTFLRKKEPTTPQVLKNGFLSLDKRMDTTYMWYRHCLEEHHKGEDIDNLIRGYYRLFLTNLYQKENAFIKRFCIQRNDHELKLGLQDIWNVAHEMTNSNTAIYMHGGSHCQYCIFRDPCYMKNTGHAYKTVLEAEYQKKEE